MKRKLLIGIVILLAAAIALVRWPLSPGPRLPIKTLDPWILQSNDPDDPHGTYIGNGYIGARVGPEGVGRTDGPCLMSGLYEGEALQALPNWADFPLYDGKGRRFELDKKAPYRQTLNMREGYVETELTLKAGRQRLRGKVTFFVPMPGALVSPYSAGSTAWIHYELTPRVPGELKSGPALLVESRDRTTLHVNGRDHIYKELLSSGETVAVYAGAQNDQQPDNRRLTPGRKIRWRKFVQIQVSRDANPLFSYDWVKLGWEYPHTASRKAWRELWKSDIIIEGDPEAQQAVRAMMFYLLSSASPEHSIPPTGISSGAWQGHIFWDADTWMFPALLLQHPELAAGMVRYRLSTLSGAMANAKARGLAGAEFAWESAGSGRETIGRPFSEERHVTANAAVAAAMLEASQRTLLAASRHPLPRAHDLLRATAEYWTSRVTYNREKDRYEILQVLPPDEDALIQDNSVYTNAAAKTNLELAVAAAKRAGKSYPAKWEEIARKMYIPFDEKERRFIAYDGYDGKKTKQADTELLIYPLMYPMPEDVKRNTFDYYKAKTDPRGPAMTSSMHAIIAAELGRPEEAYEHFVESYKPFLRGPHLMFNEKRSMTYENMCFVTGCGGALQSVIYGFGGIRFHWRPDSGEKLGTLSFNPILPPKWKSLKITNLQWQGKSFDLIVEQGKPYRIEER